MKVGVIASARWPIREPFAGGLEMHTYGLASSLRKRGHDVTIFASATSDPQLGVEAVCAQASQLDLSVVARQDASAVAEPFMAEHHAYLHLMLRLMTADFDLIQNNSLHYLPVAMAAGINSPVVTTLHTPPTPWLESALSSRREPSNTAYVSVSAENGRSWMHAVTVRTIIPNGVDLEHWTFRVRPEERRVMWFGRITPEKGTHLAIDAAHRAGFAITVAGPVGNVDYFERCVKPGLNVGDVYAGHVTHTQLNTLVGGSVVTICTPCWDEPYGLVVAESLACGTPVAAFNRGAMHEILDDSTGALAPPGDVDALAGAVMAASSLSRRDCRQRAESECSLTVMVDRYERLYAELAS